MITEYKMPDPAARDPHTAVFDKQGNLWFTLQASNMVGRLIPATGDIKLVKMPTPKSRPYGIKLSAEGSPVGRLQRQQLLGQNRSRDDGNPGIPLARPEDNRASPRFRERRDDLVCQLLAWAAWAGLDPKTGQVKEWPSPSGPKSHPYAIAVVDDIVWYNESGQRPDALVRFDPATERFQSWAIPSGGIYAGIVRHMRPTREGNLLIHQSSTNRIILVTLKRPTTRQAARRS